jgi:type I restriction enzyme M protein
MLTLNISRQETFLSEDIFYRLESVALIDKYRAFQAMNNEWEKIAVDLEIIQTEGFEAVKVVDPNMVVKKKGDTEYEVQEGWAGRVIPFDLVQATLLKAETEALRKKESRIAEIVATLDEIFESLTEEDKDEHKDAFNDDGEYIKKAIDTLAKKLNTMGNHAKESVAAKLILTSDLFTEETKLKKEVKAEEAALHQLTKETIEGLSDDAAMSLLKQKWVDPIVAAMNALPHEIVRELVTKLAALADKYAVTYVKVTDKINKAKNEVVTLIGKLRGNEFDMKGLGELQSLLRGEQYEK